MCLRDAPLHQSHIIPAFIYRWLKATGGNTPIRAGQNPQLRVQDGEKCPLLCFDCEQKFGVIEKIFAERLFHPYDADQNLKLVYGSWLNKFGASVCWRALIAVVRHADTSPIPDKFHPDILHTERTWRNFLNGEIKNPGTNEIHLLPLGYLSRIPHPETPHNFNRFLGRLVERDIAASNREAMVYVKLGKLAFFGYISPPHEKWQGTRLNVERGYFEPKKYALPDTIREFLFDRARNSANILQTISDAQREKISAAIHNNMDQFIASDLAKAIMLDAEMFGPEAVTWKKR
ncbi:MAG: hypothetical protein AAFR11_08675 [Pseudomonadota bacterium]